MWDKCGIVCLIFMCRKVSTKMWDRCGIWEKSKTFRNSLCGMNVGLVFVLKMILRDVRLSLVSNILIFF